MIRYRVDMDDIVALNRHFVSASPAHRANRKRAMLTCASAFALLAIVQSLSDRSFYPLAVWSAIIPFFCFWIYWRSGKVSVKKINQLYAPDRDKLVLCEHEMENLPDGFADLTPLSEQRTKFPAILRIDETPAHVFVFTGSMQAHIIPKKKIIVGDAGAFVTRLRDGVSSAREALP
jgi:hypothetical protein